mgnify:CR=1 FL=1
MSKYTDLIERKKREFGEKFDNSGLAENFIPYYNSGERIEVKFPDGSVKRGTVGVTTGWKPCFLLMLTSRSVGSSWTLHDGDKVVKIVK